MKVIVFLSIKKSLLLAMLLSSMQQSVNASKKQLSLPNNNPASTEYGSSTALTFVAANRGDNKQSTPIHNYCLSKNRAKNTCLPTIQASDANKIKKYIRNQSSCHTKFLSNQPKDAFNLDNSLPGNRDAFGKTWLDYLQANKADVESYLKKLYGSSYLHTQALLGTENARTELPLINRGEQYCATRKEGAHLHTPLHNACMMGNRQAIELLKKYNVQYILNQQGHTPIQTAIICNRYDSLYYLLSLGCYTPQAMLALMPFAKKWHKKHAGRFLAFLGEHFLRLNTIFGEDIAHAIREYLPPATSFDFLIQKPEMHYDKKSKKTYSF